MTAQVNSGHERREYFRVYDAIALQVEPLAKHDFDTVLEQFDEDRCRYMAESFSGVEKKRVETALRGIAQRYPDIAEYLFDLERRIGRLANSVDDQCDDKNHFPTHKVNICGNGISFGSEYPLMVGDYLVLKMQFFPSRMRLMVIAEAVACQEVDGRSLSGTFSTGARFIHIDENDREALLKHIHEVQIKSLQLRSGYTSAA